MAVKKYSTPVLFDLDDGGDVTVTGGGTGQGTYITENTTYEEWLSLMSSNPDADYDGDGDIDEDDYNYYMSNHLYDPDAQP